MNTDVRRRLRKLWRTLKNEQGDPRRVGLAVALGVIVGCSPFFGIQTLLAIGLAWLFRLNRMACLLGAQVSMPPLTPGVVFVAAQTGAWALHGHFLSLTLNEFRALPPREWVGSFLSDLLLGGLLVGGVLGAVAGSLTTHWLRARASSVRPELSEALLDALDDRLDRLPRKWRSYGAWKVRLDPVYPLALAHMGNAVSVLDLGAGMGLMSTLLALARPGIRVRAIEWDARKVEVGRQLAEGLEVELVEADARLPEWGRPDAILLVDVLHYFRVEEQREWVLRCVQALSPSGVLLVRELSARPTVAAWLERLAVRIGWNRGPGIHVWPREDLEAWLSTEGFSVELFPAGRGLFRSNWLLVARRETT